MRALAYAIAGMLLCAVPARAESYVEATGGLAVFQDTTTDRWETDLDNASWGATIAAGYCWTSFCLEGEAMHFRAGVDEGFPLTHYIPGAEAGITGIAGNAIWEIRTGLIMDPYLFGGVGLGYAGYDLTRRDGVPLDGGGTANLGDICFLSQAGGGVKMPLTDDRGWSVFTEARYVRNDFCSVTGVPHTSATEVIFAGGGIRKSF